MTGQEIGHGRELSEPDVTILISSYNQVEFLAEAITSALEQTVRCFVTVVDDGSTDGSAELAEAKGVRTVRLAHRGALQTFRSAVDEVTTPFYCLLNGDDALEPTFVERTRPAMKDPLVGFVYTGVRYVGIGSGQGPALPFDLSVLRFWNLAHGASLARKAAYDAVGGFDPAFSDHHEDWALWISMCRAGWIGVAVDEPLLLYRRHAAGSRNPQGIREFYRARWRMARRHPALFGPIGFTQLAGLSIAGVLRRAIAIAQRGREAP